VSADFLTTPFIRFYNAVESGRTCIYFGEGRTGLGHPYQLNQSAVSAGFLTTPFFTLL